MFKAAQVPHPFERLSDKCLPGGSAACENGGSCSITVNGEINCKCSRYYNGTRCEKGEHLKTYNNAC